MDKSNTPYQLIAFDMDGTLLDDKKKITEETKKAIREAAMAGKAVVMATGRSLEEVEMYREELADIRYAILESGSLLYDFREEKIMKRVTFPADLVLELETISRMEDILVQAMSGGKTLLEKAFGDRLEEIGMGAFREQFEQMVIFVPSVRQELVRRPDTFEKINFYHTSEAARKRSLARVQDLPLEAAYSEMASLELSPKGVSKGNALLELAALLGIAPESTIGVGDSGNDRTMLEMAGLGIAMENADETLKSIADAIVASNNEDGCAEAIRKYLLA